MSTAAIISVCGIITALGGAIVYINKAIKVFQQPQKENEKKFEHIYECLARDKSDLKRIDQMVMDNAEAIKFLVKLNLVTLKHLESGNETGLMQQTIKEVEDWLIRRQ